MKFMKNSSVQFSSVQSLSVVWLFATHGLQHTRSPCLSPTPGVYSKSCPLSWWCHPNISSSVGPFSSNLQSSPVSGSFPMSQFFASGGQVLRFHLQHQSWVKLKCSIASFVSDGRIKGKMKENLINCISLEPKRQTQNYIKMKQRSPLFHPVIYDFHVFLSQIDMTIIS